MRSRSAQPADAWGKGLQPAGPPPAPISPEAQRSRKRFVRLVAIASVVLGSVLSFIPRAVTGSPDVVVNVTGRRGAAARVIVNNTASSHAHGIPFRTVTFTERSGDDMSISLTPTGLLGNFAVAGALILGLGFLLRGRRRRK